MIRSAVALEGVRRTFGMTVALQSLSVQVGHGELFGIVGPDGAGKTTTLRILAGVLKPTAGRAWIEGVDIGRDPEAAKPHTAYMAQRFGLYGDLTVRENLEFYADLYRVSRKDRLERFQRLYEFSRLGEFEQRLAGHLSGGMKQKLALSCCLVHHPKVLLLDEPTFGVDPISRRELWLILHRMVAEGVTTLVSTSYLDEAERCDRVVLLNEGRALALDKPVRLQDSLGGRLYALRSPTPRKARDLLRALFGNRSASLSGDAVRALLPHDLDPADMASPLTDAGIEVSGVHEISPSLEDVFVHLVAEGTDGTGSVTPDDV
ncbi:MAG: ABC transporter ATP-binding protein [Gammaproteobacteria bacterium]|nr:ABC transporter ATP-binding protein [Gammaproteobacteria bacterium]